MNSLIRSPVAPSRSQKVLRKNEIQKFWFREQVIEEWQLTADTWQLNAELQERTNWFLRQVNKFQSDAAALATQVCRKWIYVCLKCVLNVWWAEQQKMKPKLKSKQNTKISKSELAVSVACLLAYTPSSQAATFLVLCEAQRTM